jgi:hypothetical protein
MILLEVRQVQRFIPLTNLAQAPFVGFSVADHPPANLSPLLDIDMILELLSLDPVNEPRAQLDLCISLMSFRLGVRRNSQGKTVRNASSALHFIELHEYVIRYSC